MDKKIKEKIQHAKKEIKFLDKKIQNFEDKKEKISPSDVKWDSYDTKIEELEELRDKYEGIITEFEVIPKLKKQWEGKYFKNSYGGDSSYFELIEVLSEDVFNFNGFQIEEGCKAKVTLYHGSYESKLVQLVKEISKDEYEDARNKLFTRLFSHWRIDTSLEKQNQISIELKTLKKDNFSEKKKVKKLTEELSSLNISFCLLKRQYARLWEFISKNTFITGNKRKTLLAEEYSDRTEFYLHFEGEKYRILHVGKNFESLIEVVVFQSLKDGSIWVCPKDVFLEVLEGTQRFSKIEDSNML